MVEYTTDLNPRLLSEHFCSQGGFLRSAIRRLGNGGVRRSLSSGRAMRGPVGSTRPARSGKLVGRILAKRNPPSLLSGNGGVRLPPSLFELRRTGRPTRLRADPADAAPDHPEVVFAAVIGDHGDAQGQVSRYPRNQADSRFTFSCV